jgi:Protein of unknown function (DUF1549)/Protein of unknown function (DUF1553)/Bacterial Ig-like domain (group 2)
MLALRFSLFVLAALFPSVAFAANDSPSFLHDIMPILTKSGCNQGACHGKGAGQNGFKLSLRGFAPEQDFREMMRDQYGRRASISQPENSLLLQKATAQVPHEGGRIFSPTSREYQQLARWLAAGAPGPKRDEAKLTKLTITPETKTVSVGSVTPLMAQATFSDGTQRDVTWLTKFETNDAAVATVDASGNVKATRNGATAIRGMFQSDVAVASFLVPYDLAIDERRFEKTDNKIDQLVQQKLRELRIEPSGLCDDREFYRRVMLDACGVLPTPEEVQSFVEDRSSDKRDRLIETILKRPEFTDYWTLQLGDLLQNRKERDHDVRGVKGVREFHRWLREQVASNRGWDVIARDVITAHGSTADNPAVGYYIVTVGEHRHGENSEAAESVAQAFLGARIGCAKCHNHPLERYTQDDFYHFAAFFSRVKLDRKEAKSGDTTLRISHPDANENKKPVGVVQPRTGQFLKPQPLDRSLPTMYPGRDPRLALADWVTNPANDAFAGAMVNRIWRHYFSVGLVEPVDDLRATNPPTNPALWKELNQEFVRSGYDLRRLMKSILSSGTYQRSSATRPSNATDQKFYSHYIARRLPAEVLLDALSDATGVPENFDGYPLGMRAVQVPDPGANSAFLRMFGRSERTTSCACERNGDVTLPQLLHLQNNSKLLDKRTHPDGWLAKSLKANADNETVTRQLFLRTLSREPKPSEWAVIQKSLASGDSREQVFADLLWAVLNSKEFTFNH